MTSPLQGRRPLIYAHRGDRSRAPDNTLTALHLAVDAGTDGIEIDVRRSKDGVLLLYHDDRRPEVGIFAENNFDDIRGAAPSIATLREGLDAIPRHVFVNVEIKNWPHEPGFDAERLIVDETVAEIRAYDEPARILLSSFDHVAMQRAGAVGNDFLRGQLITKYISLEVGLDSAQTLGMDALHPEITHLREAPNIALQKITDAGLHTVVWGVNAPEDVAWVTALGVAAIITDDPGRARQIVDQA